MQSLKRMKTRLKAEVRKVDRKAPVSDWELQQEAREWAKAQAEKPDGGQ